MKDKILFLLQLASLMGIWVFVTSIAVWIIHLVHLARQLHDMPGASLAISFVAVPVFLTGASVLTYVFIGIQKGKQDAAAQSSES